MGERAQVYAGYTRDRHGFLFGLTLSQLATLTATAAPGLLLIGAEEWALVPAWLLAWVLVIAAVTVPVRGRSATGWLAAVTGFELGRVTGWSRWQSLASAGQATDPAAVDLPGVLNGLRIHDGPPRAVTLTRLAIIHDAPRRAWSVTAALTHPGIGLAEPDERDRMGAALAALLEALARGGTITTVTFTVRSLPDDGAERAAWVTHHRDPTAPVTVTRTNDLLGQVMGPACLRTETFVTLTGTDDTLGKAAKEAGGGIDGHAHILYTAAAEVEAHLRGGIGATDVTWLTTPALAAAIRTGFSPADRADLISATLAHHRDPDAAEGIPLAAAGPGTAACDRRCYHHDAYTSISETLLLPDGGALLGALAPVLTPSAAGERRSLSVAYAVIDPTRASRSSRNGLYLATLAHGLRARAGVVTTTTEHLTDAKSQDVDLKLSTGAALTCPAAVVTTTNPTGGHDAEHGRRLDAAIRGAGFTPQRLDLAHDTGFVAGVLPLGVGLQLHRTRTRP